MLDNWQVKGAGARYYYKTAYSIKGSKKFGANLLLVKHQL